MTQAEALKARTFQFAVGVFTLCRPLLRNPEARVPTGQLVRASARVAANYRASCRAKSKPDFIAKLGTVIEESDEFAFLVGVSGCDRAAVAVSNARTASRIE